MLKRLLPAAVLALSSVPALADILIDQAMITGGALRVMGRLAPTRVAIITLDDAYQT